MKRAHINSPESTGCVISAESGVAPVPAIRSAGFQPASAERASSLFVAGPEIPAGWKPAEPGRLEAHLPRFASGALIGNLRYRTGLLFAFVSLGFLVFGQARFRSGWGESYIGENERTAREVASHSTGTPVWTNPPGFEKDVFTFVRVRRDSGGFARGAPWSTDAPDSDLNLSYRLQQMTSLKVNPDGRFLRLTDPDLANYPFIYMVEPGSLYLSEPEIAALRKYLLNGGFLMLDDFWGDSEWDNAEDVLKHVLPERSFVELSLDHPIYHGVFEIKTKGQVPNVRTGVMSEYTGVTWEENHDGDTRTVHHRAIMDDKGRLMVIAAHNTDNGDGWEREGESDYFFHNFSEKISYPLGINIIYYAMTH